MEAISVSGISGCCETNERRYWPRIHDNQHAGVTNHRRVRLNVSGLIFETFESTFDRFPETLLGSSEKRTKYYDPIRDEYCFARDKHTFNAILFYYQSEGILCRPEDVPSEVFNEELKFYEINDRRFPILNKVMESNMAARKDPREQTFREKGWELLENPESGVFARYISFFSILIIILSLVTYCLETVPALKPKRVNSDPTNHAGDHWFIMECVWIVWFTLELILRFSFTANRFRFLFSPFGLVDIVAVLPFFLTFFLQSDSGATSFAVLRILRVGRCLRLFKLSRYHCAPALFAATIIDCQDKLRALALCIFITVILFASSIYYVEDFMSDDSQFDSIPDTFYYVIITMVTVGYGDYVPKTVLGRILGGFCAFSGVIILYCFPTPILVVRFVQLYKEHVINEMEKSGKDTKEFENKFNDDLFETSRAKRLK